MGRLPFALALLGLLFAPTAIGATPTETSVSKPSIVCPQAKLGNEDLQAQYEKVWKQFTAEVDQATKALDSEIATRFAEEQKAGHLDLALMWDGMKKQFSQLSELRWDSVKEKKTWKQRYGEADFPDDLTALLKKCDQDYKSARERLEQGYRNIESALTKAGNLDQAVKVRAELKAILAGEPVPQPVPQPVPSPFATGYREPASQKADIPFDSPGVIKMHEEMKDKGFYYSYPTARKLIKMAKEGDEWAMRELRWSEGHPFHKKGRPFHKNTAPHPAGLIDSYY